MEQFNRAADTFRLVLSQHHGQAADNGGLDVPASFGLGRALLALGQFAPAVDAFERVLQVAPEHLPALDFLDQAYVAMDPSDRRIMQRLESLMPAQPNTGALLALAGRMCQTLSIFDLEKRPDWGGGNTLFSEVLRRMRFMGPNGTRAEKKSMV